MPVGMPDVKLPDAPGFIGGRHGHGEALRITAIGSSFKFEVSSKLREVFHGCLVLNLQNLCNLRMHLLLPAAHWLLPHMLPSGHDSLTDDKQFSSTNTHDCDLCLVSDFYRLCAIATAPDRG